jgi:hypothetical protein
VARLECEEKGPKGMEPGEERQLVPAEEVAVKSSRTKKRPRGQRIAVGRRVKPTKLIRGDGESRRKLVATCRKVSLCAAVAWRRKNFFRDIRTQGNFGPWQELGAAGVMVTLHAKLARWKGTFITKNWFWATVTRGTQIARMLQEGKMNMKDPGSRGPRDLRKERTTTNGIGAWTSGQKLLLGSGRMHMKAL